MTKLRHLRAASCLMLASGAVAQTAETPTVDAPAGAGGWQRRPSTGGGG